MIWAGTVCVSVDRVVDGQLILLRLFPEGLFVRRVSHRVTAVSGVCVSGVSGV